MRSSIVPSYRTIASCLLLGLLLIAPSLTAQPRILKQKCLGGSGEDDFSSMTPTHDGGYIVIALTGSNDGDVVGNHNDKGYRDVWIIKFDANGKQQWSRCYGGSRNEEGGTIVEAPGGGYLFAGSATSVDGDVKGWHQGADSYNQMMPDAWVVRIDSAGEILWQRCLGGSGLDVVHGLCRASGGGYVVVGCSTSRDGDAKGQHQNNYQWGDAWAAKLSETGEIEWNRMLGGSNHEMFTTVAATPDGGYLAVGSTGSNDGDVSGNHDSNGSLSSSDMWVVKFSPNGKVQWQRCLGGSKSESPSFLQRVLITESGDYIILCGTNSNDGDVEQWSGEMTQNPYMGWEDIWVVRLNPDGTIQHQRRLGHRQTDDMSGLVLLSNGDVITTGCTATKPPSDEEGVKNVDGWIVRLDSTLNVRWEARVGGSDIDQLNDLVALNDTTLVITGATRSNDGDVSGLHLKDGEPGWDLWMLTVAIESVAPPTRPAQPQAAPSPGGPTLSSIAVTPNPSRGRFALVLPGRFQGDVTVEVINTRGQIMMVSAFSDVGDRLALDLGNFPVGTYTVAVARGKEKGVAEITIQR